MLMDETELLEEINNFNNYLHPQEETTDPKILCSLLKEYIKKMSESYCPIRASLKNYLHRALSLECLDKLDMKDCVTNLVSSSPSTMESNSGISSLLTQNIILEEDIINVMFISYYGEDRGKIMKSFIGIKIEE
jgi:hypothetical protein